MQDLMLLAPERFDGGGAGDSLVDLAGNVLQGLLHPMTYGLDSRREIPHEATQTGAMHSATKASRQSIAKSTTTTRLSETPSIQTSMSAESINSCACCTSFRTRETMGPRGVAIEKNVRQLLEMRE